MFEGECWPHVQMSVPSNLEMSVSPVCWRAVGVSVAVLSMSDGELGVLRCYGTLIVVICRLAQQHSC